MALASTAEMNRSWKKRRTSSATWKEKSLDYIALSTCSFQDHTPQYNFSTLFETPHAGQGPNVQARCVQDPSSNINNIRNWTLRQCKLIMQEIIWFSSSCTTSCSGTTCWMARGSISRRIMCTTGFKNCLKSCWYFTLCWRMHSHNICFIQMS